MSERRLYVAKEILKLRVENKALRAENERLREALETAKAQAQATPLHPFCAMVIATVDDAIETKGKRHE